MAWLARIVNGFRALLRRRRLEQELDDELRAYVEASIDEKVRGGMARDAATRAARAEMGSLEAVKDHTRDAGWESRVEALWQDVRYAARTLYKAPALTVAAVVTLALGIGGNTAIFSLADAVLFRPLPVANPDELVVMESSDAAGTVIRFSYPQYIHLREHSDMLSGILAFGFAPADLHVGTASGAEAPSCLLVSANYFAVLGVQPAIGRTFLAEDEDAIVLSYSFWRDRFGRDPAIAGRSITVNGLPFTVVGVMPRGFFGTEVGRAPDVFVPLGVRDRLLPGPPRLPMTNSFWVTLMARLRADVPGETAAEQATALYRHVNKEAAALRPALARLFEQRRIRFVPGSRGTPGAGARLMTPLVTLMGVVALVLLIACANVTNLLLARAEARRREIAVRLALGAGRLRLLQQSLAETLLLAISGAAVGLLLAAWSTSSLTALLTSYALDVRLDARVGGFTLIVCTFTALLCAIGPSMRAERVGAMAALRGDLAHDASRRPSRSGRWLVSAQVAIALVLLVGAGLFVRTLDNLRGADAGFDGRDVVLVTVNPALNRYSPERVEAFYAELLESASTVPGVRTVSLADAPLLSGSYIDGVSVTGSGESFETALKVVAPAFFETMGIAIRHGRDFLVSDRTGAPRVAIINESAARLYFGAGPAIGRRIDVAGATDVEVVAVIGDTRYRTLRGDIPATVYLPMAQFASGGERTLHVRAWRPTVDLASAIRQHVHTLNPALPARVRRFTDVIEEQLVTERLIGHLSALFGGLAMLLTAVGLYGVVAYSVQRRTREIGIRMALGAEHAGVRRMIVRETLQLVAAGIVVGVPAALWVAQLVRTLLFGVTPADPATFASAGALVVLVGAAAGYLPARRASRLNPVVALRQ